MHFGFTVIFATQVKVQGVDMDPVLMPLLIPHSQTLGGC